METDNTHLAEQYFGNLVEEDEAAKRENRRQNMDTETWLQQEDSSSRMFSTQWEDSRHPSPTSDTIYAQEPALVNMGLINDPGTPSDTALIDSSSSYQPPGNMEEFMWFPQSMRGEPQPLDLRPLHYMGEEPEWERSEYIPSGMFLEANNYNNMRQRPQSVSSTTSEISSRLTGHNSKYITCPENIIKDKLLKTIPVKELNKRLHGLPREKIDMLKKMRRTLKNRDYAQVCRTRRTMILQKLQEDNKALLDQIHRWKSQLEKVTHERDTLRQTLQFYRCDSLDSGIGSLNNSIDDLSIDDQNSPELYL